MSMGKFERLNLHVQEGATFETPEMGKAFIDVEDDGRLSLNWANQDDQDEMTPSDLQDLINALVMENEPVTISFMPKTDRSRELSVPVTESTNVIIDNNGAYGAGAFDEPGVLDRVQKYVNDNGGKYRSNA